ncbi:hypothetical protein B0H13DRAFT_1978415 [Mycena leptocephala]|nr:hypothetical protein B0H13DRAFT_1978415 [Mycena leptocephala]
MSDVEARSQATKTQFLVIHSVEDEDLNMSGPLRKERSQEIIVVPTELISIHVERVENDESLSSSALTAASTQPDTDTDNATATEDPYSKLRNSRVRFRSRVRITSGLHRHHRRVSATSSLSSSRSSSISAPLRSPLTEDNCTPGWGTLGQRVNLFAISNRQAAAAAQARNAKHRARRRQGIADLATTERTALLGAPPPLGYNGHLDSDGEEEYYDDESLLSRQIDLVFGKWPGRLLNHHWWWWQLEPIICCGFLEENDTEDTS